MTAGSFEDFLFVVVKPAILVSLWLAVVLLLSINDCFDSYYILVELTGKLTNIGLCFFLFLISADRVRRLRDLSLLIYAEWYSFFIKHCYFFLNEDEAPENVDTDLRTIVRANSNLLATRVGITSTNAIAKTEL
jgi:hypothetical protein